MNAKDKPGKSDRYTDSNELPRHEEIASLAYKRYLEEGCPEGRALDHWLQAEVQLKRRLPDLPETETPSPNSSVTSPSTLLSSTPATAPLRSEGSFFSEEQAAKTIKRGRKPRQA